MADAGNFGGSVPECKRNTVLPPLLSGDCLFSCEYQGGQNVIKRSAFYAEYRRTGGDSHGSGGVQSLSVPFH
ncbi:hypothetical protein C9A19_24090, partial [Salmonella enterica]|nr:hypothetical protein [Salmonella enterica]